MSRLNKDYPHPIFNPGIMFRCLAFFAQIKYTTKQTKRGLACRFAYVFVLVCLMDGLLFHRNMLLSGALRRKEGGGAPKVGGVDHCLRVTQTNAHILKTYNHYRQKCEANLPLYA